MRNCLQERRVGSFQPLREARQHESRVICRKKFLALPWGRLGAKKWLHPWQQAASRTPVQTAVQLKRPLPRPSTEGTASTAMATRGSNQRAVFALHMAALRPGHVPVPSEGTSKPWPSSLLTSTCFNLALDLDGHLAPCISGVGQAQKAFVGRPQHGWKFCLALDGPACDCSGCRADAKARWLRPLLARHL